MQTLDMCACMTAYGLRQIDVVSRAIRSSCGGMGFVVVFVLVVRVKEPKDDNTAEADKPEPEAWAVMAAGAAVVGESALSTVSRNSNQDPRSTRKLWCCVGKKAVRSGFHD